MYLRGMLQVDIGNKLGLTQSQISRDLKAIRAAWLKSSLQDFNELKARELARIDDLELEYWQAWQDSKGPTETEFSKLRDGGAKYTTEKNEAGEETRVPIPNSATEGGFSKTTPPIGDLRCLAGLERCGQRRDKLLGFDAPVKQDINLKGQIKTYQNWSPDNWDKDKTDES